MPRHVLGGFIGRIMEKAKAAPALRSAADETIADDRNDPAVGVLLQLGEVRLSRDSAGRPRRRLLATHGYQPWMTLFSHPGPRSDRNRAA